MSHDRSSSTFDWIRALLRVSTTLFVHRLFQNCDTLHGDPESAGYLLDRSLLVSCGCLRATVIALSAPTWHWRPRDSDRDRGSSSWDVNIRRTTPEGFAVPLNALSPEDVSTWILIGCVTSADRLTLFPMWIVSAIDKENACVTCCYIVSAEPGNFKLSRETLTNPSKDNKFDRWLARNMNEWKRWLVIVLWNEVINTASSTSTCYQW